MSTPLARLALALADTARERHQRRLLWLAGDHAWCASAARELLGSQRDDATWYGTRGVPDGIPALRHAHVRLGRESALLIYDAHDGFDADACGALCGTLRGGGLMLLLTPPAATWPTLPDHVLGRWVSAPYGPGDGGPHYRARLVRLLEAHPAVCRVAAGQPVPAAPTAPGAAYHALQADARGCLTGDQRRAVDAILALAATAAPAPLVLTADRGRGKSAALGIAARCLLGAGPCRIVVTAPRRAAVAALFAQAGSWPGGQLEFAPPDALLRTGFAADLLLVDEAAAIPAALLAALLEHQPRCVFATTVHGYEGSGRGFALRFRTTLEQRAPGWRELVLRAPVRWAADDPLEPLLFRALLLDSTPVTGARLAAADVPRGRITRLDRALLARDAQRLDEVCGLLVEAHYRTTPNDLRGLLDAPDVAVYAVLQGTHVVAVAVTVDEGGFDAAAAFDAWRGTRRRRGHLVAQSLAAHAGLAGAPELRFRRVQRIAVHAALRRQGLGRTLLAGIADTARQEGHDLLCASFAAAPDLLAFWLACGLAPARVGFRRDAASGAHAAVLLQALSAAGTRLCDAAATRLARDLPALLCGPLRDLEPEVTAMLRGAGPPAGDAQPRTEDWQEACAFAFAARGADAALPAVRRLVPHLVAATGRSPADPAGRDALVARFVEGAPWASVAARLGVAGRKAAIARLRAWLRAALREALPADLAGLPERLQRVP